MLTALAAVIPPRIAHAIARRFGFDTTVAMFCTGPCCPAWTAWAPKEAAA